MDSTIRIFCDLVVQEVVTVRDICGDGDQFSLNCTTERQLVRDNSKIGIIVVCSLNNPVAMALGLGKN